LAVLVLWYIRSEWWPLIIAVIALGPLALLIQMGIDRQFRGWHLAASSLMLLLAVTMQMQFPTPYSSISSSSSGPPSSLSSSPRNRINTFADEAAYRIGQLRWRFIYSYPEAGSNIDSHYEIQNLEDLIYYLPRATAIGLFAPFPHMWVEKGAKLGLSARALSGFETLAMYFIHLMILLSLPDSFRKMPVWHLLGVVFAGAIAVGLVVVNIGALYRFRYAFWVIAVILGVGGGQQVVWPRLRVLLRRPKTGT
jgi:hypothetical protein